MINQPAVMVPLQVGSFVSELTVVDQRIGVRVHLDNFAGGEAWHQLEPGEIVALTVWLNTWCDLYFGGLR